MTVKVPGVNLAWAVNIPIASLRLAIQTPMPMRVLGNTGLQASVLGMGFWATFGAKPDLLDNQEGVDKAKACMRVARSGGVNLFDNAETCAPRPFAARRPAIPTPDSS